MSKSQANRVRVETLALLPILRAELQPYNGLRLGGRASSSTRPGTTAFFTIEAYGQGRLTYPGRHFRVCVGTV